MTEPSRLDITARALGDALEALADALALARPEAVAASAPVVDVCVREFRAAARDAAPVGDILVPALTHVAASLARCRRLGASLALLAGDRAPSSIPAHGYTAVGQPAPIGGEGAILTARV